MPRENSKPWCQSSSINGRPVVCFYSKGKYSTDYNKTLYSDGSTEERGDGVHKACIIGEERAKFENLNLDPSDLNLAPQSGPK